MNPNTNSAPPSLAPVNVLAATLFLIPAVGVPNADVLQDTLKSAFLVCGTLASALVLLWTWRSRPLSTYWHICLWLPIGLAAHALGSTVWSHAPLAATEAIRWTSIAIAAWLTMNIVVAGNGIRLLWAVHAGAVAAAVWATLQYWFGLDWFPQAAFPASTFVNRNFYAEFAVCALPYSIWLLHCATPRRWAAPMASSVALCLAGVLATGTRSALLAIVVSVSVGFVFLLHSRAGTKSSSWAPVYRRSALLAFIATLVLLGTVPSGNSQILKLGVEPSLFERFSARSTSLTEAREYSEGSYSERLVMWKATARMAIDNPLFGVGAGAWEVYVPLYQNQETTKEFDYYAHNELFQLLGEYGLVFGGLVCATALAFLLKWCGSTYRQQPRGNATFRLLRIAALCSLLALLTVGSAGFPLHLAACCSLLALTIGILGATDLRFPTTQLFVRNFAAAPRSTTHLLVGLTGGTMLVAIVLAALAFKAEHHLNQSIALVTQLVNAQRSNKAIEEDLHNQALQHANDGVAINRHYRKLIAVAADRFAAAGDIENAVALWRVTANSRPHVAALWENLAKGLSHLGRHEEARAALNQYRRLRPTRPENIAMEITLLRNEGHVASALQIVRDHFRDETYEINIVQAAIETSVFAQDWALAIEALERRNQSWPELKADGYFQLGMIYRHVEVDRLEKALAAFSAGLQATEENQREAYRKKVPQPYRDQL